MAEWVTNGLGIRGPVGDILRVKLQLGHPFKRQLPLNPGGSISGGGRKKVTFSNPIFSFWNIINPSSGNSSIDGDNTDVDPSDKYDSEWFEKAWGTSADVAVADGEEHPTTLLNVETDSSLSYQFDTVWADCRQAISALAAANPSLEITYYYEYPEGEGGSISFDGVKMTVLEEYQWKCSWCDYIENDKPPEECPSCGEANDNF